MNHLIASLRVAAATLLVCVLGYTSLIAAFAAVAAPGSAAGSLLEKDGVVIGSRLLAQPFTRPEYFWPRPSAVSYNAAGAGGSNKSPANPELTERASGSVAAFGATADRPLPADLAAASGGGLDPHISEAAALFQADRVAAARSMPLAAVRAVIDRLAFAPGGPFTRSRIVNVLELNLALDSGR